MKKWLKGFVFVFAFIAGMLSCRIVFADDGWGTYGDNIKWHFYEATGTLQIEGEGAMPDARIYEVPWNSFSDVIKKVEIGEGVTHIGNYAFHRERNLTEVKFSSTVESIGSNAFSLTGLAKLNLPTTVTSLGTSSFEQCDNLKSLVVPGSVKEIPMYAFRGCSNLKTIRLEKGIEKLRNLCLTGNSCVTINIPDSVTTIDYKAFLGCKMQYITIPESVLEMGEDVFSGCTSLKYVDFNGSCAVSVGTFRRCQQLTAVRLGEKVTAIKTHAFWYDHALASIFVPGSVNEISNDAFYGKTGDVTFYGYTDTAAYNYAGMNQFVKFMDVEAQGMDKWEKVWNEAVSGGASSSENDKKMMKLSSLTVKKGATMISGKLSVSDAVVKIKIEDGSYKKATVNKESFSIKTSRLKKGTIIRIRVTKDGYRTVTKLVKVK